MDFAHPDVVEYPEVEQPETSTVTKRLVLLLGLAYLFLAALTSGLAYTGYFTTTGNSSGADHGPSGDPNPGRDDRPDDPLPRPRPPVRDPDAPGLHTRPDGTRYLVMPLPADLADRFRDRANAVHASHAAHAVHPFRAVNPTHAAHAVHPAHAFGGGAL